MLPRCRYLVPGSELHIEIDDHQQPENERKGSAENQRTAAGVCLQDSLRVLLNQRARPLVHSTFPSSPSPFSVIIVCWLRSFVVTGERHVYKSCIDQGPGCKIQPRACRLAAVRYKSGGAPPRPRPRPAQPPPRNPPLLVSSPNPPSTRLLPSSEGNEHSVSRAERLQILVDFLFPISSLLAGLAVSSSLPLGSISRTRECDLARISSHGMDRVLAASSCWDGGPRIALLRPASPPPDRGECGVPPCWRFVENIARVGCLGNGCLASVVPCVPERG